MKVLNRHLDTIPANSIDISRKGPLGNPFVIGQDGTREEVVALHLRGLRATVKVNKEMNNRIKSLKGFNLVCYCAPLPCHGDNLKIVCEELNGQEEN